MQEMMHRLNLHFNSHFTASASALLLYEEALCQDFDQKVNTANKLTQSGQISENLSLSGALTKKAEEMGRSALSAFMAKEEDIQTRKMEVQERVLAQRRLSTVREVGNRIIRKRIHVRVEHVQPSRCHEEVLQRIKRNDALKAEAKARGEVISTKRQPKGPKPGFMVEGATLETVTPIPYDVVNDLKGGY
ncbi:unnamed protein product [Fraxinus pennsylvanica]|uniref:Uncharacterized protein n=1 Tax=Fraxinus pennsylvanica TaxID=56036 RepID=A0AAD2AAA6_9LAMI|nr:unnamed protein product [Fraxinus pennsylvanica]